MIKYIFPILFICLVACTSEKEQSTKNKSESIVKTFKNEAEMDERVQELKIIVESSDLIANSLRYEKGSTGESIEVFGHVDKTNTLQIVEEVFSEGNGKSSGSIFYYLENGKPFVTQELIDEVTSTGEGSFVDRISYYNAKGKVLKTKERRARFQDEISSKAYQSVPLHEVKIDRAMRALNSEKEFETTFQGFVDQDIFSYLIVGPNYPDGFTSALRLDYKDKLIQILLSDPKNHLGAKLKVNFENYEDRGFRFQVYAGGKFAD